MKIAILFTCYNRIEKTRACVESIQAAINYAASKGMNIDASWFIVDAGSSDGTPKMLEELLGAEWKKQREEIDGVESTAFGTSYESVGSNNSGAIGVSSDCCDSYKSCDSGDALFFKSKMHMRVDKSGPYYSQGMRQCMEMLNDSEKVNEIDYVMLVNDDVVFYEEFLYRILDLYEVGNNHGTSTRSDFSIVPEKITQDKMGVVGSAKTVAIVGATDDGSRQTYGGVRYTKEPKKNSAGFMKTLSGLIPRSIKYSMVSANGNDLSCNTFNANCVVMPYEIYASCPIMDANYVHGLGDFDYGMCIYEAGYDIKSTTFYVGRCANNTKSGTWMDTTLSRLERVKRLNSVKGSPTKQWYYYLKKHFGIGTAVVYSVSPYVRILMGK